MKMLLIDNFDSFTQNIAQYLYEVTGFSPDIVKNTLSYDELRVKDYDAVVLSPGPGHPGVNEDFGICGEVILNTTVPLLGICLGHQGIVQFLGGTVEHAPQPVHGYRSRITHCGAGLFRDLPEQFEVVRYHSLIGSNLPSELRCTAWTDDGLIMAVEHLTRPVWGVQFHPESIESEHGHAILSNFVRMAVEYKSCCRVEESSMIDSLSALEAYIAVGGLQDIKISYREINNVFRPNVLFSKLYAEDEYAYWLDCEGSEKTDARYSIMGSGQGQGAIRVFYNVDTQCLTIEGPQGKRSVDGDFFYLMNQIFEAVHLESSGAIPFPFKGGFVGYLGYEIKALTGGHKNYRSQYPDALLMYTPHFFVFDHHEEKIYECLVTDTECPPVWPLLPDEHCFAGDLTFPVCPFLPGAVNENAILLADGRNEYVEKIRRSLEHIANGESYEICLTNRAKIAYSGSALTAYTRMREASPVPYGAFLSLAEFSVLSASPEMFLRIDEYGMIQSRPIKGTRPRGVSVIEDKALYSELLSSTKDRAENLMIVDLVRHDLNKVCFPGTVHVPELFAVESFSSVHQLVSTVRGHLRKNTSSLEAIRACFPGGSMTGAPKKRTMEIIDTLETSARGVYSGVLGWLSFTGAVELSIVIRTAILKDGHAEFGIGGAIITDSDPQEEFEEILVKASVPYYSFTVEGEA